ncbi:neuronal acetylcholine receptor subunit alpha-3-like [Epargyreus clarus]|uniref:neuronal acetylcholine receptor subunit alpha-3-like n=1 Tax=Epargyreus clarus TaxID=520877 RepID=UPI003C2FE7F7
MAPLATLALRVVLLLLLAGSEVSGACSNVTLFATQLDALLGTYEREAAPRAPLPVLVALDVRHATVNERENTVRLLADFRMSWDDPRLSWNSSEWGCDSALVSAERLWLPDVGVLGAAASDAADNLRARLAPAGRVAWLVRLDLAAPLAMDLSDWPNDQHQVVFKFGSRSHFVDEIDLTISDFKATTVFESGAWELMSVEGSLTSWQRAGEEKRVAQWAVVLRRRAPAHALAARATLLAAALLLAAAALLPPAMRPPLCAAAAITTTLWSVSAGVRAAGALAAPRALSLLCALGAGGGAAAAAAAVALRVARCSRPPPHALRTLLSNAALLRHLTPLEVAGAGDGAESSAWAAAAQLLDALCVLALLLLVLVVLALHG